MYLCTVRSNLLVFLTWNRFDITYTANNMLFLRVLASLSMIFLIPCRATRITHDINSRLFIRFINYASKRPAKQMYLFEKCAPITTGIAFHSGDSSSTGNATLCDVCNVKITVHAKYCRLLQRVATFTLASF